MTFNRINDHTVRCILHENEIGQMGYELSELFQQQDLAENFLRDIINKAREAGFSMPEYQTIQSIFMPNHEIVLNITDMSVEKSIDDMIQNYLNVYEAVNLIGRERLLDMMNKKGLDKIRAFQECMAQVQNHMDESEETRETTELQKEDLQEEDLREDEAGTIEEMIQEELKAGNYQLLFRNLNDAEQFSKLVGMQVPSKLYKDKRGYSMSIASTGMKQGEIRRFLFIASEFSQEIKEDNQYLAYLEERADVIIREKALEVLRNL